MTELCDAGRTVLVETSGEADVARVDPRVHKIMDLKCPGSGESHRNRWSNLEHLDAARRDQVRPRRPRRLRVDARGDRASGRSPRARRTSSRARSSASSRRGDLVALGARGRAARARAAPDAQVHLGPRRHGRLSRESRRLRAPSSGSERRARRRTHGGLQRAAGTRQRARAHSANTSAYAGPSALPLRVLPPPAPELRDARREAAPPTWSPDRRAYPRDARYFSSMNSRYVVHVVLASRGRAACGRAGPWARCRGCGRRRSSRRRRPARRGTPSGSPRRGGAACRRGSSCRRGTRRCRPSCSVRCASATSEPT